MSALRATVMLYRKCLSDTLRELHFSWPAALFLFVGMALLALIGPLVGGLHQAAGFALGFAAFGLAGWYLALVEISATGTRRITLRDIREAPGRYFGEVLTMGFVFTLPLWFLGGAMPSLLPTLATAAAVIFNPAPELIYQSDEGLSGSLSGAVGFVQDNWPEWFAWQLPTLGLLMLGNVALGAPLGVPLLHHSAQLFGPFFGFIDLGRHALMLGGISPLGLIALGVAAGYTHIVMVFRGKLYKKLARSTRRGRIWSSRM